VNEVVESTAGEPPTAADLALVFASYHYQDHYREILEQIQRRTGARHVAGCSGWGIIGTAREVEDRPALSLLLAQLPGVQVQMVHVTQDTLAAAQDSEALIAGLGIPPAAVNAWLVLADPFRLDIEGLVALMEQAYPGRKIIGGLASGTPVARSTSVFLDGAVHQQGAVAIAIGGAWTVRSLVSQGATPIGETWTITAAHDNILETAGGRPAYEVLVETVESLPEETRRRAAANLLVGLAMNEYSDEYQRGDFLIRNLLGVDRESGAIAVSAYPRVGQTIQFQMRDGRAADEELVEMLRNEHAALGEMNPAAAMLCSCNGRGIGLFGEPDHDARRIAEALGPVPLAGFFCNGEIGPVGEKTYLHGFTASLALFVPHRHQTVPIKR
jgi:small ligand-binding sensory domain FIST